MLSKVYIIWKVFNNSDDENVKAKAAFWLSRGYNDLNDKVKEKVGLKNPLKISFHTMVKMLQ